MTKVLFKTVQAAIVVMILLAGMNYAQAHNTYEECAKTIKKLPKGMQVVDLHNQTWYDRFYMGDKYCLVMWDTYHAGYLPYSPVQHHGCIYHPESKLKYIPDLPPSRMYEFSGFAYQYMWSCPRAE